MSSVLRKNNSKKKASVRNHNKVDGHWNCAGPRIREFRLKASPKITQEDLAGRLAAQGILLNRTAIAKIEARTRVISDFELLGIAKALKVPVELLLGNK